MAVDHHADDDEEDAAQHGEEHGEEDGDGAHPFLDLAHWRREGDSVTESRGGDRERERVSLTSEQVDVVHAGYGDLLFLLLLFVHTPQHRQLVEFQGDDVVVICSMRLDLLSCHVVTANLF